MLLTERKKNGIHDRGAPPRQARQREHRQGAREAQRGVGHLLARQGDHLVVRDAERARPAGLHHRGALRERGQQEIPPREPVLEDLRPLRRAAAREAHGPAAVRGTRARRGRGRPAGAVVCSVRAWAVGSFGESGSRV